MFSFDRLRHISEKSGKRKMLIGNPLKFAFLIERVQDWETDDWKNGIMFVIVNDGIYPKEVRTTTFNSEIFDILNPDSAFANPFVDTEMYNKSNLELFQYMVDVTFPKDFNADNDYRYLIPFHEINDSGYYLFIISNDIKVKILAGRRNCDRISFIDCTEISKQEYMEIKSKLTVFYHDVCDKIRNHNRT